MISNKINDSFSKFVNEGNKLNSLFSNNSNEISHKVVSKDFFLDQSNDLRMNPNMLSIIKNELNILVGKLKLKSLQSN